MDVQQLIDDDSEDQGGVVPVGRAFGVFLHDWADDEAWLLEVEEQGGAVARVADLREGACLARGRDPAVCRVQFSTGRDPGLAVPDATPLSVALAQPWNADGLSVQFVDGDVECDDENEGEDCGPSAADPGKRTVVGVCARCRRDLTFSSEQGARVTCPFCQCVNLAVDCVNRQAECARCQSPIFRYEGELRMECPKCHDFSRVGKCSGCSLEFVFREEEAVLFTELPCADPQCKQKTPVNWDEEARPVTRKQLVPAPADDVDGVAAVTAVEPQFHLIVQFHLDRSEVRRREFERALAENLANGYVRAIHLFVEGGDPAAGRWLAHRFPQALASGRLCVRPDRLAPGARLTFRQAFEFACTTGELCIIANTDIAFDETLAHVDPRSMRNKLYALSRYDVADDGRRILFNRFMAPMSQDAWIFMGAHYDGSFRSFIDLDFELGRMGSDNRAIYEFERSGVRLSNPCEVICCRHFHSQRPPSSQQPMTVPGPYKIIQPSDIL